MNFTNNHEFCREKNEGIIQIGKGIKFYIRIYEPKLIVIRIQNLDDKNTQYVKLIDNDNHLAILQHLIGNEYSKYIFSKIEEITLNTVHNKQNMLKNKQNWNNLKVEEENNLGELFIYTLKLIIK